MPVRLSRWLVERAPLAGLLERLRAQAGRPVPRRLSWLYTAGTLAAFFFGLQFVTGCLLLTVYVPDEKLAYSSVQALEHKVPLGFLVRQMHAWGSSFIVLVLGFHVLKVLWYGAYKRPRELTWFAGCILLALTLAFCLSGYLLPWNQLGYWATRVSVATLDAVPGIGQDLKALACGAPEVSGRTIGRFFALHVMILPWLLAAFAVLHVALVLVHGITPKASVAEEQELGYRGALDLKGSEPFFPRQVYRELLVLNLGFALLVTAAVYFPWELGEPASPQTPQGIKPEWYFLPVYQFLKYFDESLYAYFPFLQHFEEGLGLSTELLGICCVNLVALLAFLLPVLDRGKHRRMSRRPIFGTLALLVLLGVTLLGVLGYLSGRRVTAFGRTWELSFKGYPTLLPEPPLSPVPEEPRRVPGGEGLASAASGSSGADGPPAAGGGPPLAVTLPAASHRADGLPLGGTCGPCHEEQLAEWQGSVHDRNQVQCAGCHGGIDTAPPEPLPEGLTPEVYAHLGIKQKRSGGAARPAKKELTGFCGRCHEGVRSVFAPEHQESPPEGRPSATCVSCHSNHTVKEAGDETYDGRNAYTEASDPRHAPFAAARAAFREVEVGLARVRGRLGALREAGYPAEALEKEIEQAERGLKDARPLVHGLGRETERLAARTAEVRAELELVRGDIDRELARRDERWKLVAGVWAVAAALSALIAAKLRAMPA
ncbi:MAG: cytochrome b N-terminal domain-containing protein [Planctomycetes bacterium]|nr:cytochrome b N-terminal domain-containing protein [Planctomycetota bacterium]